MSRLGNFANEVVTRRVPNALLVYFGVGWGLLEFGSYLEARFQWSPGIADAMLAVFAVCFPAVLVITWTHGKPGRDPWGRLEKVVLAVTAVSAVAIAIAVGTRDPSPENDTIAEAAPAEPEGPSSADMVAEIMTDAPAPEALPEVSTRTPCIVVFDYASELGEDDEWLAEALVDSARDLLGEQLRIHRGRWVGRGVLRAARIGKDDEIPDPTRFEIAKRRACAQVWDGTVSRENDEFVVALTMRTDLADEGARQELRSTDVIELFDRHARALIATALPDSEPTVRRYGDGFTTHPEAAKAYYLAAEIEFREPEEASREFDRALEVDPTFAVAAVRSAGVAFMQEERLRANELIERALSLRSRLPRREQFLLSFMYYMLSYDYPGAEKATRLAIEESPRDADLYERLAMTLGFQMKRAEMKEALVRAYELEPDDEDRLSQLRTVAESEGDYGEAIEYARRLQSLRPDDPELGLTVAQTLMNAGRFGEAQAMYDEMLLDDPSSRGARRAIVELEFRAGDPIAGLEASAEQFEREGKMAREEESEEDDDGPASNPYLRVHFRRLCTVGRPDEAFELFAPVFELLDGEKGQSMFRAMSYNFAFSELQGCGLYDEIEALVTARAETLPPYSGIPLGELILTGARLSRAIDERDAEAARAASANVRKLFEGAFLPAEVKKQGTGALGYNNARASERWADAARLIDEAETAGELGRSLETARMKAEVYVGSKRWDDATAVLDEWLTLHPNDPWLLVWRAKLALAQERPDDARAALERALRTWSRAEPEFERANEARALLESLSAPSMPSG